jgi:hypothetical protein
VPKPSARLRDRWRPVKRRRTVDQWRRDVFASQSPEMTSAVKVLLLFLADHMSQDDHKVSLRREVIAKALGVHNSRVAERLAKAVKASYLTHVSSGYHGRQAVYQAQWPDAVTTRGSVLQSGNHSDPETGRKVTAPTDAFRTRRAVTIQDPAERENVRKGTALQDAYIEADLSVSPTDLDVGSYDEHRDRPTAYGLTVCEWHGFQSCPTDCANHPHAREESA